MSPPSINSSSLGVDGDAPINDSVTIDSEFCSSCGCIINTTKPELPIECIACGHPIDTQGKQSFHLHLTPL